MGWLLSLASHQLNVIPADCLTVGLRALVGLCDLGEFGDYTVLMLGRLMTIALQKMDAHEIRQEWP